MKVRDATVADAPATARIYNEGIDDRVATFDTRHRTAEDVVGWLDGRHPVVVVEDEGGAVIGFGATPTHRTRECYAWIAEFSTSVTGNWITCGAMSSSSRSCCRENPRLRDDNRGSSC